MSGFVQLNARKLARQFSGHLDLPATESRDARFGVLQNFSLAMKYGLVRNDGLVAYPSLEGEV